MSITPFKYPLIGIFFSSLLLLPLLSHSAPIPPDMACETAGGVWDDSLDTLCQPCNLCLSSDGELREDSLAQACPPECRPWCRCPEGTVFYNYQVCLSIDEYPTLCQDDNPQAITCAESGGQWVNCVDTCTYCISDSGETMMTNEGCPEVCDYGCNCPEGESFTEEGCKPDAEVLPSCNGVDGGEGEDNGEVEESDSCDQIDGRTSLWLLFISLIIVITHRKMNVVGA